MNEKVIKLYLFCLFFFGLKVEACTYDQPSLLPRGEPETSILMHGQGQPLTKKVALA